MAALILLIPLLALNVFMTKQVLRWEPSPKLRRRNVWAIWLVPVVGAYLAGSDMVTRNQMVDRDAGEAELPAPPTELSVAGAPPFAYRQHLAIRDQVAMLDWPAAAAWTAGFDDAAHRAQAVVACQQAWLQQFALALGQPYHVLHQDRAWVLSTLEPKLAKTAADYINRCRQRILRLLPGAADPNADRHYLLVVLDDESTYYRYLELCSGAQAQVASSGVYFPTPLGGYFMTLKDDLLRTEPIIAHEMTHAAVSHLHLPLWLDEGLAVNTEYRLLNVEVRRDKTQHHGRKQTWDAHTIQWFWFGEAFHHPDLVSQAYELAQVLVELLAKDWPRFAAFLQQADRDDGGAAAAAAVLGVDLPRFVSDLLEAPYTSAWQPHREQRPDLDVFQQQLLTTAASLPHGSAPEFDAETLLLSITIDGEERLLPCEVLFQEWAVQPAADRSHWLPGALQRLLTPPQLPEHLDAAAAALYPELDSAFDASCRRLQALRHGQPVPTTQIWRGDLVRGWMWLHDNTPLPVPPAQCAVWQTSPDHLTRRALDNLQLASTKPHWREIGHGLYQADWHDGLDHLRLLVPDCLRSLRLSGEPLVAIPTRDTLLLTGSRNNGGLLHLVQSLQQTALPQHLSNRIYILNGQDWQEFNPPSEWQTLLRQHERLLRVEQYQRQKPLLERYLQSIAAAETVADVSTTSPDDAGDIVTSAIWAEPDICWLPEVDRIQLRRAGPSGQQSITIDWATLLAYCPLTAEPDLHPPRYRAVAFPDAESWTKLSAKNIGFQRRYY